MLFAFPLCGLWSSIQPGFCLNMLEKADKVATRSTHLSSGTSQSPGQVGEEKTVQPLLGESPAMLKVLDRIQRAAQVDSPVLIWGEEGAGKSLIAETIHRQSRRAGQTFVVLRTREIPDALIEGELFGPSQPPDEPAASECGGFLRAARGGTLLIDEIAGLPRTCQAKLLQLAEGRQTGGSEYADPRPIDFRLMATTRHAPTESVERGAVREDLYYRLAVVTIRVPSLRERREDIPCLVRHFLAERSDQRDKPVPRVEPELMRHLVEHPWPGNIRQLRDWLNMMVLAEDAETLGVDHLHASLSDPETDSADYLPEGRIGTLAELERAAVMRALKLCQGNRTHAAKALGISVRTLQRKLRQWGG
jgi:DNA-binding NtrC family response regulator